MRVTAAAVCSFWLVACALIPTAPTDSLPAGLSKAPTDSDWLPATFSGRGSESSGLEYDMSMKLYQSDRQVTGMTGRLLMGMIEIKYLTAGTSIRDSVYSWNAFLDAILDGETLTFEVGHMELYSWCSTPLAGKMHGTASVSYAVIEGTFSWSSSRCGSSDGSFTLYRE